MVPPLRIAIPSRSPHTIFGHGNRLLDGNNEQANSRAVGGLSLPSACIVGPAGGIGGTYEVAIAWRGLEEHINPTIHDCGSTSGKYGTNNEFRHVMVISAFVDNL